MRRVPILISIGVLLVTAATATLYWLQPTPAFYVQIELVDSILARVFHEQTDRLILLFWLFITVVLALLAMRRSVQHTRVKGDSWLRAKTISQVVVIVSAIMLLLWAVMWLPDEHGVWPGIRPSGLSIGFITLALILVCWWAKPGLAALATILGGALTLSFAVPALLQLPSSLLDPYHFLFIADEIAAPAAGKFPLGDYIPQYVTLLGWPVAPVLNLMGASSLTGVVLWLVFLQVVAFAIAIMLPVVIGGWRFLVPGSIVVLGPSLVSGVDFAGPVSYFQTTPARIVLPSIAIFVAFRMLRTGPERRRNAWAFLGLGLLLGATLLNNPDYGAPALAAVILATILSVRPFRYAIRIIFLQLVGVLSVFITYDLLGRLAGHVVNWPYWVTFQTVYGAQGHSWSTPVRPFGIHIAVVALFMAAVVAGAAMIAADLRRPDSSLRQQGVALLLVGSWSMLSLPYFIGRSLVPTLIGGYAFMIGMTVAAFLPTINVALKALLKNSDRIRVEPIAATSLGIVAIVGVGSFWSFAPLPSTSFDRIVSTPSTGTWEIANGGTLAGEFKVSASGPQKDERIVAQALQMSSLIEITTGIPSASVPSNPLHFTTDPVFVDAQCVNIPEANWDYLWIDEISAEALAARPTCAGLLDFESPVRRESGNVLLRRFVAQ